MRSADVRRRQRCRLRSVAPISVRILWIDPDSAVNVPTLEVLMARGMSVVTVGSSAAGLAMSAEREFDVVVVDCDLPDMHCLDAISSLVRNAPGSAVILTLPSDRLRMPVHATRLGAWDVLSKPLVVDDILEGIDRAIHRRPQPRQAGDAPRAQRLYEDLCAIVATHPRVTLGQAASRLGVDRHVVERTVRVEAGLNFGEWRKRRTMHRSAHLIAHSTLSIKEVAYELGDRAPRSFIRAFKTVIGFPPARFRAQVRRRAVGTARPPFSLEVESLPQSHEADGSDSNSLKGSDSRGSHLPEPNFEFRMPDARVHRTDAQRLCGG